MRRGLALLLLLSVVLVGCNPTGEAIKWPQRPKEYKTIASLSPSTTEIAASMAYYVQLVGRTAACNYPPSVSSAEVVAQVKPDYEKLKALSPGIVVYDKSIYNDQDIQQIKALGIDTFEFKGITIDDFTKEILQFGSLMGVETDASTYVDKIVAERKAAEADPIKPEPKVAVIMPGKGGEHLIAGVRSFQADVVKAAGGNAVGPDADRFVPINAEELVQLNPDMIITAGSPDALMQDARLKSINAIKNVNVRGLDQDVVVRHGFRVDRFIKNAHNALQSMAQGRKGS